jgi:hypothetical protein
MSGTALAPAPAQRKARADRLVGWQGFTVRVPEAWDLTGFSGSESTGYLRVDDGLGEQALEVKWATEPLKAKQPPDVSVRRESYFRALRQTARKKRLELETRETEAPRGVARAERRVAGFTWLGDRKAIGVVWHCVQCRRTVIAQVLGARSGKGGLSGVAAGVLATLACHGDDPSWRTWALYDLHCEMPSDWKLEGQQLMNVYLRLSFAHKTSRLTLEQWALANVARRDAYLDVWLATNSKGPLREARYRAEEAEVEGHAALDLAGGPGWGLPMVQVAREVLRFKVPATRFRALAWQCETTNKVYAVQSLRVARSRDILGEVVARLRCHPRADDPRDGDTT